MITTNSNLVGDSPYRLQDCIGLTEGWRMACRASVLVHVVAYRVRHLFLHLQWQRLIVGTEQA